MSFNKIRFSWLEEFNLEKNKLDEAEMNNLKIGDEIKVDVFQEGDNKVWEKEAKEKVFKEWLKDIF